MLYSYQGAIPSLKKVTEDSNKTEVYRQNLEILEPNINKMRNLYTFYRDQLVPSTRQTIEQSKPQMEQDPNNTAQAPVLSKLLDLVLRLDYMKTWQSQLNNDYSMYRRAMQLVRANNDASAENDLRTFFVMPSSVIIGIRTEVERVEGYEMVLAGVINWTCDQIEAGQGSKDELLRGLVFSAYLLENLMDNEERMGRLKRRTKLSRMHRLLTANPSINLHQQLTFDTSVFLKKNCAKFLEKAPVMDKKCIIL